jgi:hypothetical protein
MRQEYNGKKNTLSYPQFNHCAYFISAVLFHSGLNMKLLWQCGEPKKNTHTHTHNVICGDQMTQFHMCEEEALEILLYIYI